MSSDNDAPTTPTLSDSSTDSSDDETEQRFVQFTESEVLFPIRISVLIYASYL